MRNVYNECLLLFNFKKVQFEFNSINSYWVEDMWLQNFKVL